MKNICLNTMMGNDFRANAPFDFLCHLFVRRFQGYAPSIATGRFKKCNVPAFVENQLIVRGRNVILKSSQQKNEDVNRGETLKLKSRN